MSHIVYDIGYHVVYDIGPWISGLIWKHVRPDIRPDKIIQMHEHVVAYL